MNIADWVTDLSETHTAAETACLFRCPSWEAALDVTAGLASEMPAGHAVGGRAVLAGHAGQSRSLSENLLRHKRFWIVIARRIRVSALLLSGQAEARG